MPETNSFANAATAAEQLRRLLLALPALADDRAHSLSEIAERVGASEEVVRRDLTALVSRVSEEPAGFTEGVSLLLSADSVQFQTLSGHFRRPMALTREELHALDLGLAMLQHESPPDERPVLERARTRLQRAIGEVVNTEHNGRHASLANESVAAQEIRRTLQQCIRKRRIARITYRSATADADDVRPVQPLGVVWARGSWYLAAWCKRNEGLRVFRLDRIRAVTAEQTRFTFFAEFSLELVLRDGKVLIGDEGEAMSVRYSPHIARWIAEREGLPLDVDGSVTVEMEAIQEEWAVRHVLRYGPDAEVLAPAALREAVAEALRKVIAE
jgi:proteasome accessory factor C